MPAPPSISSQLVGVTDSKERGRIKAQGLVAHVSWVEKRLPFSWQTSAGYVITVYSVAYVDPAFEVVIAAWEPPVTVPDPDNPPDGTKQVQKPIYIDNPVRFINPPILLGGSLVEDPLAVAKQIIEDAVGIPRTD